MLCYRDRAYCPYWRDCAHGDECDRALTDEVERAAKRSRLLVAGFLEKPSCFEDAPEDSGGEGPAGTTDEAG